MATRNEIGLSAQHLLPWNNWYYTGLADFLQSSVQGIQLQSTFSGGIGRIIKNTGRTSFNVYGGFAWQKINYQEALLPSTSQQVTSGLIGTSLKLFYFDRTTNSFQSWRLFIERRRVKLTSEEEDVRRLVFGDLPESLGGSEHRVLDQCGNRRAPDRARQMYRRCVARCSRESAGDAGRTCPR